MLYFESLKELFSHKGRHPQNADLFNSVLNYGYGMLYNEIESACLHAGLDPCLGVYHSDRSNKPSLVCDVIEEFRVPVVDAAIMPLMITKKLLQEKHMTTNEVLSKNARRKIIVAVKEQLQKKTIVGERQLTLKQLISHQMQSLSHVFLERKRVYFPSQCSFSSNSKSV